MYLKNEFITSEQYNDVCKLLRSGVFLSLALSASGVSERVQTRLVKLELEYGESDLPIIKIFNEFRALEEQAQSKLIMNLTLIALSDGNYKEKIQATQLLAQIRQQAEQNRLTAIRNANTVFFD